MYLLGISAGAGLSAKYIALYGHHKFIKSYGSISNPFNFARLSYHLENAFFGRILSKVMAITFKKNLKYQKNNPFYHELLKQHNLDNDIAKSHLENADTVWQLDSVFTHKLASNIVNS